MMTNPPTYRSSNAALPILLALAVLSGGCDSPTASTKPDIDFLEVTPRDTTVVAGRSVQLVVTARDGSGRLIPRERLNAVFSLDDSTRATVTADGLVTTRSFGTLTVTVAAQGRRGERRADAIIRAGVLIP